MQLGCTSLFSVITQRARQGKGSFGGIFIPCHFSLVAFSFFFIPRSMEVPLTLPVHTASRPMHLHTHTAGKLMREGEHAGPERLIHPNDKDHYGHKEGGETAHFIVIRPESSLPGAGKESDGVAAP